MKSKKLYLVLFSGIFSLLMLSAFTTDEPAKNNKSLIKFSHELHSEMSDCESCHSGVTEAASLSGRLLPTKDNCAECHDVDDDENCNLCHYEDVYEPLMESTSDIIFDHQFHLNGTEMECVACHKGLDEVEYSFEAEGANPSMAVCFECHNDQSVAVNVCESCHIATANLIPDDHLKVSFMKDHKFNATDESCVMCHDDTFCEACHVATSQIDEANTGTDFYAPYSPHRYTDGVKQQNLARVHDFNYRYTHGIDAIGKSMECQTCHSVETFCIECHESTGGDFALLGILPSSHRTPGFVTIGFGTGGGEHAILAKRDIESCAACHDTPDADPVCMLCHTELQ